MKTYGYRVFNIDKKVKDLYSELFIDNDGGNIQDSDDEVVYPKPRLHEEGTSLKDQTCENNETEKQHIVNFIHP